ncbi:MAG: prolipoprotein diacylglyceryl transferase [candidate division Zixibacteria bacterium]|nr:prolipoprotein diacylglyceryl transferase [candidate division Zixibacteria bacterium]
MHPDLFSLGPIHIKVYGLALAISFFVGVWVAAARAKKSGLDSQVMIDLSFIILVAAIIGSRLFYVVYHVEEFTGHWLDAVNPFQSSGEVGIAGLSMMGGIVLAIIAVMVFFIIKRMLPWPLLDSMAPAFFLGLGITRIGCFFNGCCFGVPTECSCGVVFPPDSMAGWVFPDAAIWPTQLFSSAAGFILFGLILLLERKKTFHGFTFWLAVMLYSGWRFIIDFIRYYEDSMIFASIGDINFTRNQFLCICLIIIAIIWFIYLKRKNEKPAEQPA